MNNEQRVLDEIDALVDAQLQQEPSGYDHNLNQDKCEWCGEDWHALAITQRLQWARRHYQMTLEMPADYDYSTDESPIMCEGSDFIGPRISWRLRGEFKASIAKRPRGSAPAADRLTETRGLTDVDAFEARIRISAAARCGYLLDEAGWRNIGTLSGEDGLGVIADGAPYIVGEHFQLDEGSRVGYQGIDGEIHYGRVESHDPAGNGSWTVTIGEDDPPARANRRLRNVADNIMRSIGLRP